MVVSANFNIVFFSLSFFKIIHYMVFGASMFSPPHPFHFSASLLEVSLSASEQSTAAHLFSCPLMSSCEVLKTL